MRRMGLPGGADRRSRPAIGDTDDEEIIAARATFQELNEKYKAEITPRGRKGPGRPAACSSWAPSGMNPAGSTTSCAAVPAGRATPATPASILSLEDDLMRLFGGERINNLMEALGIDEDTPIENKMLTNSIESAQRKVEEPQLRHPPQTCCSIDDVMNRQREIIYSQRDKVLERRKRTGQHREHDSGITIAETVKHLYG